MQRRNNRDSYDTQDEIKPELPRGKCRNCQRTVLWMVTHNNSLIPAEPSTVNYRDLDHRQTAPNPRREWQWLFVFQWKDGHRCHGDYCPAQDNEQQSTSHKQQQQPPHKKQIANDDLFRRRGGQDKAKLYGELEITPEACPEVIRAAYRALCLVHHPDHNQGVGDEKLKRINAAYEKIMGDL